MKFNICHFWTRCASITNEQTTLRDDFWKNAKISKNIPKNKIILKIFPENIWNHFFENIFRIVLVDKREKQLAETLDKAFKTTKTTKMCNFKVQ